MKLSGERGQRSRKHASTWELAEKIAEKEGKLTNATETAGTARIFRLHAEVAGGGFSMRGEWSKGEGRGEGKGARARTLST